MSTSIRFTKGSSRSEGRPDKGPGNDTVFKVIKNKAGEKILMAAVAEDEGPYPGKSRASTMAVEMAGEFIKSEIMLNLKKEDGDSAVKEGVSSLFNRINTVIYSQGVKESDKVKLSLLMAVVFNSKLFVGHIGTGKIIQIHEGSAIQLTEDYSWIQQAIRRGDFSRDSAMQTPNDEAVPMLGVEGSVEVQVNSFELEPGDGVALISHGISEYVPNHEIAVVLRSTGSLTNACERLISIAGDRGRNDSCAIVTFAMEPVDDGKVVNKEAAREEDAVEVDESLAEEPKKEEKKGCGCSGFYMFLLVFILSVMAVGGLVGYKHAKKLIANLTKPGKSPAPPKKGVDHRLIETGRFYLIKEEETARLNFFRLNGRKLRNKDNQFELFDAHNRLDILPVMDHGTYTAAFKLNSKNFYEVYEGSSRNKINIFEDRVSIFLTKGAKAILRPDEIRGVTSIEVHKMGSPLRVNFSRQNLIFKVTKDPYKPKPLPSPIEPTPTPM